MDLDAASSYRALCTRDPRFDGRLFVGVRTTGIYCRPICPARTPRREHVQFFPSAAAAQEAGFRPCLRCRPETAPDLGAWRGSSSTVARALSLIELGGLDDGDVGALAERLGIGDRQLRRLFRQHLGASPVAVAQTRRVLLAKQLLHETQLSMGDVALASGFGSVRRFNETFQRLFDRPPASLRRTGKARAKVATPGAVTVALRYRAPYDWEAILGFLAARALPGVEVVRDQSYARTIVAGGRPGVVTVRHGKGATLVASIRTSALASLPAIIAKLRRLFDLAADPHAIDRHLSQDERLASLVAARPGVRVPGAWDGFELAVRAVLGQQISVMAAARLAGRLAADHGEPLGLDEPLALDDLPEGLSRLFPAPERLAALAPSQLPMPATRAATVIALARAVVEDRGMFQIGRSLPEVIARLTAIKGIGDWTAQYIAMREMREPDAFPAADLGLLKAMTDAGGRRPTGPLLQARAERWRPWRAYAAQHLWLEGAVD